MDISVRTLQRRLHRHGLTYSALVERVRHEEACRLLQEHGKSIAEIAVRLGYSDPSHFSRAFRRWEGVSPRAHQRRFKVSVRRPVKSTRIQKNTANETGRAMTTMTDTQQSARAFRLLFILLSFSVTVLSGCANLPERKPMNAELQEVATIPGIPDARSWADTRPENYEDWMSLSKQEIRERYPETFGKPHNYLAISGGGARGAFGAGLLNGWTDTGTRPEFTIVTGVSTGSILAPFAFLGSDYDHLIKKFYTTLSTEELLTKRSTIATITKDAATDATPIKNQLALYVDDELVAKIAAEYDKGRELFIGTTNLDAGRSVNWNITAIAASGDPNATQLIRDIILASSSVPGVFPPVLFTVEADGQLYDEMHVDGGVSSNVFVYPIGLDWTAVMKKMDVETRPNLYVLRNGYLHDAWKAVKRNTLSHCCPFGEHPIDLRRSR